MRRRAILLGLTILGVGLLAPPAAAGGGGCHDVEIVARRTTTIAMEDLCFRPGVAHVAPGDTVTVVNRDQMLHNLYGQDWYAGDVQPGGEVSRTFTEPGVYAFACTLHAGMTGAVVVDGAGVELAAAGALPGDGGGSGGGVALAVTAGALVLCGLLFALFAAGLRLGRRQPATT